MATLFDPLRLGALELAHRVVLPPLTRMRAGPGDTPTALMAEYYAQRASPGGLLIAEASQVSPLGKGYPATPGCYSPEQEGGWAEVVRQVHARGGLIVLQLWHVGRLAHSSLTGRAPFAPSARATKAQVFNAEGRLVGAQAPEALSVAGIAGIVEAYRRAAELAQRAGFDGVEIHGANGYLPDQFLEDGANLRDDHYGGSVANRMRFLLEVVQAAAGVFGIDRVGVRLSPYGATGGIFDSDPPGLFGEVARALNGLGAVYLHLIEPRANAGLTDGETLDAPNVARLLRQAFKGPIIDSGGFDLERANAALEAGEADAVAFGRAFIANPDLPERLRIRAGLNPYQRATFYGSGARGYTDYPRLDTAIAEAR